MTVLERKDPVGQYIGPYFSLWKDQLGTSQLLIEVTGPIALEHDRRKTGNGPWEGVSITYVLCARWVSHLFPLSSTKPLQL